MKDHRCPEELVVCPLPGPKEVNEAPHSYKRKNMVEHLNECANAPEVCHLCTEATTHKLWLTTEEPPLEHSFVRRNRLRHMETFTAVHQRVVHCTLNQALGRAASNKRPLQEDLPVEKKQKQSPSPSPTVPLESYVTQLPLIRRSWVVSSPSQTPRLVWNPFDKSMYIYTMSTSTHVVIRKLKSEGKGTILAESPGVGWGFELTHCGPEAPKRVIGIFLNSTTFLIAYWSSEKWNYTAVGLTMTDTFTYEVDYSSRFEGGFLCGNHSIEMDMAVDPRCGCLWQTNILRDVDVLVIRRVRRKIACGVPDHACTLHARIPLPSPYRVYTDILWQANDQFPTFLYESGNTSDPRSIIDIAHRAVGHRFCPPLMGFLVPSVIGHHGRLMNVTLLDSQLKVWECGFSHTSSAWKDAGEEKLTMTFAPELDTSVLTIAWNPETHELVCITTSPQQDFIDAITVGGLARGQSPL